MSVSGATGDPSGSGPGIVLVIPAFRPSERLHKILQELLSRDRVGIIRAVVVVDDGSGPGYREVFDEVVLIRGVTLLRHAVNLGKGAALRTAFNHVLVRWPASVGVVTADADGQHAPDDILRVAEALACEPQCLVLGIRKFDRRVPLRSLLGNWLTRGVFRVVAGYSVRDTQTGLRGWPRAFCEHALYVTLNGYDFELETLVSSDAGSRAGTEVRQVPIDSIYIDGNVNSHFDPIRDSMRIYFVFVRYMGSSLVTATVDYLIFTGLLYRFDSLAVAQAGARLGGILVAFTLVRNVVYKSDVAVLSILAKFIVLASLTGLLSYSAIQFLAGSAGVPVAIAKLVAEGALFLGNFAITRAFLFRQSAVERPGRT